MNHSKETNQYYANYFENAICLIINGKEIDNPICDYKFTEDEINEMNDDAKKCVAVIGGTMAEWTGKHTKNSNADVIIDSINTEIKYVSGGNGTYLNTTLEYIPRNLGFTSYREYMKDEVYPYLESLFGMRVYDHTSPITSTSEASEFRHNHAAEYDVLQKLDKKARTKYVSDLYDYLLANPEQLARLVSDSLSKAASGKSAPDRLVIYNYNTKKTTVLDKDTILNLKNGKVFRKNGLSLVFGNIRFAIGWQNGNGLCNPTIRVFIKE